MHKNAMLMVAPKRAVTSICDFPNRHNLLKRSLTWNLLQPLKTMIETGVQDIANEGNTAANLYMQNTSM